MRSRALTHGYKKRGTWLPQKRHLEIEKLLFALVRRRTKDRDRNRRYGLLWPKRRRLRPHPRLPLNSTSLLRRFRHTRGPTGREKSSMLKKSGQDGQRERIVRSSRAQTNTVHRPSPTETVRFDLARRVTGRFEPVPTEIVPELLVSKATGHSGRVPRVTVLARPAPRVIVRSGRALLATDPVLPVLTVTAPSDHVPTVTDPVLPVLTVTARSDHVPTVTDPVLPVLTVTAPSDHVPTVTGPALPVPRVTDRFDPVPTAIGLVLPVPKATVPSDPAPTAIVRLQEETARFDLVRRETVRSDQGRRGTDPQAEDHSNRAQRDLGPQAGDQVAVGLRSEVVLPVQEKVDRPEPIVRVPAATIRSGSRLRRARTRRLPESLRAPGKSSLSR